MTIYRTALEKLALLAVAALASTNAPAVSRADVIAATCMSCHGPDGKSSGEIPSLAGMEKARMIKAMKEFRADARPSLIMKKIAAGYSEAEYEAVAEVFAGIR
jgi:cytochrome c553